jgi:hypothetical protein
MILAPVKASPNSRRDQDAQPAAAEAEPAAQPAEGNGSAAVEPAPENAARVE